jgi:hypothetical protein
MRHYARRPVRPSFARNTPFIGLTESETNRMTVFGRLSDAPIVVETTPISGQERDSGRIFGSMAEGPMRA